jgi:hypothetical protein
VSPRLPASPSLEQLRRRAKDLLRALRAGDPSATKRLAEHHPHPRDVPVLADAQLVIAREHGFPGWSQLRTYVDRVAAHGPDLQHAYRDDLGYHRDRASGLLASAVDASPGATAAFARWNAPLTEAGARTVVAREHGFASWRRSGATSGRCAPRASRLRRRSTPSRRAIPAGSETCSIVRPSWS